MRTIIASEVQRPAGFARALPSSVIAPARALHDEVLREPPEELDIQEDHLASAIGNLIDNAMRHGQGEPVQVTLSSAAGRLCVQVQDRGKGISAGNQPKVWDRFFTTERDRGGTGLGLSIVQAIVLARKGEVSFETSPNGTCFRMVL